MLQMGNAGGAEDHRGDAVAPGRAHQRLAGRQARLQPQHLARQHADRALLDDFRQPGFDGRVEHVDRQLDHLDAGQRQRCLEGRQVVAGHAVMAKLAGALQRLQRLGRFQRDVAGRRAVQEQRVDMAGAQAFQAVIKRGNNVSRRKVRRQIGVALADDGLPRRSGASEQGFQHRFQRAHQPHPAREALADLGHHEDLVAAPGDQPADLAFAVALAIDVGRVEQVDAEFQRAFEQAAHVAHRNGVAERADAAAAEAEYGKRGLRGAESALHHEKLRCRRRPNANGLAAVQPNIPRPCCNC
jgi:hypothetical protein